MRRALLLFAALWLALDSPVAFGSALPMAAEWTFRLDGSRIINFSIIFLLCAYLVWRFGLPMARGRAESIRARRDRLERERGASSARLEELENQIAEIGRQVERIDRETGLESERIGAIIISNAKAEAERIIGSVERSIELEVLSARDRLIEEAFSATVDRAEAILLERFSEADQGRLIDERAREFERMARG